VEVALRVDADTRKWWALGALTLAVLAGSLAVAGAVLALLFLPRIRGASSNDALEPSGAPEPVESPVQGLV
jgi:hypothetical protein